MTWKFRVLSFALLCALFLSACFDSNTVEKASALFREGKYDEAVTVYEAALKKNPNDLIALKAIADIKLIKKDFPGAIEGYKRVIEANPSQGVRELVSMLSYGKNVRDMASDAIKSLSNGRAEVVKEIMVQIASGNNYVKIDYLNALARVGNSASSASGEVAKYLTDEYFGIRKAALDTLSTFDAGSIKEADAISKIVNSLKDDNITVVEAAVKCLGSLKSGANETVPSIIEMLSKQDDIKAAAKQAIADIGPAAKSTVPTLSALTDSKNPVSARVAAIDSLALMGSQANDAVPVLIPLLQDSDNIIKTASANALTKIGKPSNEAVQGLVALLKHKDVNVKLRAITELSEMGKVASSALVPLELLSKDSSKEVREEAKKSYEKIAKAKR